MVKATAPALVEERLSGETIMEFFCGACEPRTDGYVAVW